MLLLGGAAEEELPVTTPGRRADGARPEQLTDPRPQPVAARQRGGVLREQRVLRYRPRHGVR
jgi:hypothetical protein